VESFTDIILLQIQVFFGWVKRFKLLPIQINLNRVLYYDYNDCNSYYNESKIFFLCCRTLTENSGKKKQAQTRIIEREEKKGRWIMQIRVILRAT
jgi:hypothetical protein